jgi:uncharacterized protein
MSDSLKINLTILPEEGLRLTFFEGESWFKQCFSGVAVPEFSLIRVDGNCLITRSGDTVYVRGDLKAQINQECGRCLEMATIPIGSDFAYTLVPEKADVPDELELSADELEISCYRGDFIDLEPLICEQIILQTPMKALCGDNCKGLCPRCGINLNRDSCGCSLELTDERLAALKNFKVKN